MSIFTSNRERAEIPPADLVSAPTAEAPLSAPENKGELSPLAKLANEAAFSFILPKLQAVFESIHQPGYSLLDTLYANTCDLQDAFTQALYAELSALDADFSCKITLRLDASSRLALVGRHPNSEEITAMLRDKEELSLAFAEIAAQSAALRDLRSLSALMAGGGAAQSYKELSSRPGENTYQISLKGEMNHFYFTRS